MSLSPRARALLDTARVGFEPDAEASARNERALVSALGAGIVAASGGVAAGKAASGLGLGTKLLAGVLLVAAGSGAYATWGATPPPAPAVSAAAAPTVSAAPATERVDVAAPSASTEEAPPPSPPRPAKRTTTTTAPRGSSLEGEVAVVRRGAALLAVDRPEDALAAFEEHARRYPDGVLAEERESGRIRALCALGRRAEASTLGARFVSVHAGSPYVASVRASCAFVR